MGKTANGFDQDDKVFVCPMCGMTSLHTDYCYRCDYLVTDEEEDKLKDD